MKKKAASKPEMQQEGKYLVVYRQGFRDPRAKNAVPAQGDINDVQVGDVVSYWDGNGAQASAYVQNAAVPAGKIKTVVSKYGNHVMNPSVVVTFDRITQVLRPIDNKAMEKRLAEENQKAAEVSAKKKAQQEKLAALKAADEERRRKKAIAYKAKQDKLRKAQMAAARKARVAELKAAATMSGDTPKKASKGNGKSNGKPKTRKAVKRPSGGHSAAA